jgi:hypothetical protein
VLGFTDRERLEQHYAEVYAASRQTSSWVEDACSLVGPWKPETQIEGGQRKLTGCRRALLRRALLLIWPGETEGPIVDSRCLVLNAGVVF